MFQDFLFNRATLTQTIIFKSKINIGKKIFSGWVFDNARTGNLGLSRTNICKHHHQWWKHINVYPLCRWKIVLDLGEGSRLLGRR